MPNKRYHADVQTSAVFVVSLCSTLILKRTFTLKLLKMKPTQIAQPAQIIRELFKQLIKFQLIVTLPLNAGAY